MMPFSGWLDPYQKFSLNMKYWNNCMNSMTYVFFKKLEKYFEVKWWNYTKKVNLFYFSSKKNKSFFVQSLSNKGFWK